MDFTIKRDVIGVNWEMVAELYWVGMVGGESRPEGREWEEYVQRTRGEFEGSDVVCLVMSDGRCVGGGHAVSDGARDAAIYGVVVHPEFRRRGIGIRIVQELLKDLEGVSVLLNSSEMAASLYARLGFQPLKRAMGLRYPIEDVLSPEDGALSNAAKYDGMTSSPEIWGPGGLELAERLADAMNLPSDSVVMDLGAGSGEISCFLAREYGWRIVAVEHWNGLDAVRKIQRKAGERGLGRRITAMHGDATDLPLADESVDGIFCQGTFEMIADGRPQAIREIFRVLRPGGTFGIGEPMWKTEPTAALVETLSSTSTGEEFLKCFRTMDWTKALMRSAGFKIIFDEICADGPRWWSQYYEPWRDQVGRAKEANHQDELTIWDRDQGQFQGTGIIIGRKADRLDANRSESQSV